MQLNNFNTLSLPMELLSDVRHTPYCRGWKLLKRIDDRKIVSMNETIFFKTVLLHMSLISIYNLLFRREMKENRSSNGIIRVPSSGVPGGGL